MKKSLTLMLALIMVLCMIPTTAFAKLDTGHKIDVRFTVLYVGDEFNIGYNYGTSENTQFVCQYSTNHSDTAYNNHTIAISDIKAAADRATVNSGYQIVGWSKESNANPTVWSLNKSGTTACNKGTTIYLVAKNPNPQPTKPTANDILGIVGNNAVKVKCTTAGATHADKEKSYGLKPGSYTIGNVEVTAEGGYTCTITVHPEQYVADYVSDPDHTLAPAVQTGTIKLSWNGTDKKWELANPNDVPVEFTVKCATTVPGSVSAVTKTRLTDVANVPLPSGVDINVEPVVTFTDNNPSATLLYAFTVTGTPGAEVVIKDDGATFIKNTTPISTEPQQITVTLPDAVGNERETSTTVYGYRIFSVNDIENGKLVNNATANVESDDNNKKEAKAEVDAKDDRTLKNTLTVKKLVSGNAANKTEKFTFRATFTFPVPGGPNHCQQQQIIGPGLFKATSTFPVPGASANPDGVTYGETVEITFELAHGETRTFSYKSDEGLKTEIDNWMKESGSLSGDGDAVFAKLSYKVEETDTKGYTRAIDGAAEGKAEGNKTVTFTNTKNKPNDDHGGHYHPTTTPVPVIVIPPKTGDMPFWYSIAQFLGLVK